MTSTVRDGGQELLPSMLGSGVQKVQRRDPLLHGDRDLLLPPSPVLSLSPFHLLCDPSPLMGCSVPPQPFSGEPLEEAGFILPVLFHPKQNPFSFSVLLFPSRGVKSSRSVMWCLCTFRLEMGVMGLARQLAQKLLRQALNLQSSLHL